MRERSQKQRGLEKSRMNKNQKEQILQVLGQQDYKIHYLFPYESFFNTKENFTEFNCERQEGKAKFLPPIQQLNELDAESRIFAEIYGMEEDRGDRWIYSDTLVIFSRLSIEKIKDCFAVLKMGEYLYPSDIGGIQDSLERFVMVEESHQAIHFSALTVKPEKIYYCWWD